MSRPPDDEILNLFFEVFGVELKGPGQWYGELPRASISFEYSKLLNHTWTGRLGFQSRGWLWKGRKDLLPFKDLRDLLVALRERYRELEAWHDEREREVWNGYTELEVAKMAREILCCEMTKVEHSDTWRGKTFTASFEFGGNSYEYEDEGPNFYAEVGVLNRYLNDGQIGNNNFSGDDLPDLLGRLIDRYDELANWRMPPIPSTAFDQKLRAAIEEGDDT